MRTIYIVLLSIVAFGVMPAIVPYGIFVAFTAVCAFAYGARNDLEALWWIVLFGFISDILTESFFGAHALLYMGASVFLILLITQMSSLYTIRIALLALYATIVVVLGTNLYQLIFSGKLLIVEDYKATIMITIGSYALFPILLWMTERWERLINARQSLHDLKSHH